MRGRSRIRCYIRDMESDRGVSAGAVIGGCVLEAEIGRGGMGVVWRARQRHPSRPVAVKLLAEGDRAIDAETIARFGREARLLAGVRHPAVVQIHASGVDGSADAPIPYIVMELVEGALPLVEFARRSELPLRQRIELLARTCEGIGAAHSRGVIHRDIKPGNLLVDGSGAVRIVDFGIARPLERSEGDATLVTRPGRIVGTPQYMSPEQFGDEPDAVDARSDVYALGLVAHELLSGRPPYDLTGVGLSSAVRIVCELAPERLSDANPACRGDLDAIVAKALAKDPQRRYATANDLAADLRRALGGEPVSARRLTAAYQASVVVRRYPIATGATIGVAALVLSLLALFAWQREQAARAVDEAERARKHTGTVAAALTVEIRNRAFATQLFLDLRGADLAWLRRSLAVDNVSEMDARRCGRSKVSTYFDGGRYAYSIVEDRLVRSRFVDETEELAEVSRASLPYIEYTYSAESAIVSVRSLQYIAASDDGRYVAMRYETFGLDTKARICVWDTHGSEVVFEAADNSAEGSPVALSGDGSLLFRIGRRQRLHVTRIGDAQRTERFIELPELLKTTFQLEERSWLWVEDMRRIVHLEADATGRWIALANERGAIVIVDRVTRVVSQCVEIPADIGQIRDIKWSGDGKLLLVALANDRLMVLRRDVAATAPPVILGLAEFGLSPVLAAPRPSGE